MRVAIVKNYEVKLTETFIRTHAEHLPAKVSIIHKQPPEIEGGVAVPGLYRLALSALGRLGGERGTERASTAAYVYLLKKTRPDVVLAEYGTTAVLVREACAQLGLPLVVHFHGYDASRTPILDRYAEAYAEVFHEAAAVVAVSRSMRDRLIGLGALPERVVVNPCSVDLDAFPVGKPGESPPIFLAVGRLVEKKAPHLLVLAFAEVHRQYSEARLRIVGDGPLSGVVADLVAALELADAVDLLGPQPHDVVREEMQRARAFVQHSVIALDGDSEGTPVSVLEASASGLPVVSTHHAGIPDAVLDGVTGFIVAERDVGGMAERMLQLARDPQLATRMGRLGRERVEAFYRQDLRMDRLWEVVRRAAEGRALGENLLHDPIELAETEEGEESLA